MEGYFQTPIAKDNPALNGTIKADIFEVGATATTPTRVIRTDNEWQVVVEWELDGGMVAAMAGQWDIHVIIEQMGGTGGGPGLEMSKYCPPHEPFVATPGHSYKKTCVFTVADMAAWSPAVPHEGGLYRILVTVAMKDAAFNPLGLAGFVDLGLVQIFTPN